MAKAPTKADLARVLVREFPDQPNRSLARKLYNENKFLFPNLDSAYSSIRYVRGLHGKKLREAAKSAASDCIKDPTREPWKAKLPPSQAEPWKPLKIAGENTVLVLSDAHVPYHATKAIKSAVKHGKKRGASVVLLNGDWCDFYSVSRWDRNPKKRDFVNELERCEDTIAWLRSEFPDARIIFKQGNHEERFDKFIWNKAPELWGLSNVLLKNILHLDDHGVEVVESGRPIMLGKLACFHGHEMPGGMFNPVNQARGQFLRLNASSLAGHGHRTSHHAEPDWTKKRIVSCWSTGCLCDMTPDYARINKWNWGFAIVQIGQRGEFVVANHTISDRGDVW